MMSSKELEETNDPLILAREAAHDSAQALKQVATVDSKVDRVLEAVAQLRTDMAKQGGISPGFLVTAIFAVLSLTIGAIGVTVTTIGVLGSLASEPMRIGIESNASELHNHEQKGYHPEAAKKAVELESGLQHNTLAIADLREDMDTAKATIQNGKRMASAVYALHLRQTQDDQEAGRAPMEDDLYSPNGH